MLFGPSGTMDRYCDIERANQKAANISVIPTVVMLCGHTMVKHKLYLNEKKKHAHYRGIFIYLLIIYLFIYLFGVKTSIFRHEIYV